jgi:hypothetical protein
MNKNALFITFLVLFFVSIGGGLFLSIKMHELGLGNRISRQTNKHYFNDNFIVYGVDNRGTPFLAEIYLQRSQKDTGEFAHFYRVGVYSNGKFSESEQQKTMPKPEIQPFTFLDSFKTSFGADFSAKQTFVIDFTVDSISYSLATDIFNGDFIVRNDPDYMKHVSFANGTLAREKEIIPVSIAYLGTYAEDSNKYIYFDGFYQLQSTAHLLVLWDEAKNVYLIDKSRVKSTHQFYKSHTWVLNKSADGYLQKAFTAGLSYNESEEYPTKWIITLPTLQNATLSLETDFLNDTAWGYTTGTIKDSKGTREVSGYSLLTYY